MLECVVNVSEGRDEAVMLSIAAAAGRSLLDVHVDLDHHRSVYTIGAQPAETLEAVQAVASAVAETIDLGAHSGVHPRIGALDVAPFVAWPGSLTNVQTAIETALSFARWWSDTHGVPVYLYGSAHGKARGLPHLRRDVAEGHPPDFGPHELHPRLGATAIGVRPPLVAVNCILDTRDVQTARQIAALVRERDGGLPGVRALGFQLESRALAQVSMNLVALWTTGVEGACERVRELARQGGVEVAEVELVGLVGRAEAASWSDSFVEWSGLDRDQTVEARLAARAT